MALAAALAVLAAPAFAHPSRGIAVDREGRVYFSDLVRVWRIDGSRRHLVRDNRGNHTHSLIADAQGILVWEESQYDPASQTYTETIWQLAGNRPERRFGPVRQLQRGIGIARDSARCTWHADQAGRDGPALVHRKCPGRAPVRLVGSAADDGRFRPELVNDIAGVALAGDGRFLFRHGGTVRAVDRRGRLTLVAGNIARENFGIALEPTGGLLVVEHGNRRLLRFAGGRRQLVAASPAGWAPTGVAAGPGGSIYLLESSVVRPGNPLRMQVRQVAPGAPRLLARVTVPQG